MTARLRAASSALAGSLSRVLIGVLALGLCAALPSCGKPPADPVPDAVPDAGAAPLPKVDFEFSTDSLRLAPGDTARIGVHAEPAGVYELQLSLPRNEVSAFLDRSRVTTDESGDGSFNLTVIGDGQLTVQASLGRSRGQLDLEVRERASGQLTLYPVYNGPRTVDQWIVSIAEEADCSNYDAYEDGESFEAAPNKPIELDAVPAATPIQILVRGEHYVFGCREVELTPGNDNVVLLPMTDRPLQVQDIAMAFFFGFDTTTEFAQHLEKVITTMRKPLADEADDAAVVLSDMSDLARDSALFDSLSQTGRWPEVVQDHLLARGQSPLFLQERLDALLRQGTELLFEPEAVDGRLQASEQPGAADYHPEAVGQAPASALSLSRLSASAPLESTSPESTEPMERWLRATFSVQWRPAQMLSGLAAARVGDPVTDGLGPALSRALACDLLGPALAAASERATPGGDAGVPTLSADDLTDLCEAAISRIWQEALAADASVVALEVSAAGPVEIDDYARPLGFMGNWVGALYVGESEAPALDAAGADGSIPVRGAFSAR